LQPKGNLPLLIFLCPSLRPCCAVVGAATPSFSRWISPVSLCGRHDQVLGFIGFARVMRFLSSNALCFHILVDTGKTHPFRDTHHAGLSLSQYGFLRCRCVDWYPRLVTTLPTTVNRSSSQQHGITDEGKNDVRDFPMVDIGLNGGGSLYFLLGHISVRHLVVRCRGSPTLTNYDPGLILCHYFRIWRRPRGDHENLTSMYSHVRAQQRPSLANPWDNRVWGHRRWSIAHGRIESTTSDTGMRDILQCPPSASVPVPAVPFSD